MLPVPVSRTLVFEKTAGLMTLPFSKHHRYDDTCQDNRNQGIRSLRLLATIGSEVYRRVADFTTAHKNSGIAAAVFESGHEQHDPKESCC